MNSSWMKSTLLSLFSISVLALSACSSDGSSPTDTSHAPAISDLQYSPQTASVGQGGGAITVNGTIRFIDAGGDVTTLKVGTASGESSTALQGLNGVTNGTVGFLGVVPTTQAGTFAFQIWLVDSKGNASNKLSGTFTVR